MNLPIHNHRRGFTLLELLSSIAILALLVFMLTAAFTQASKTWQLADNRIESFQSARLALETLALELEGATVRSNGLGGSNGRSLRFDAIESTTDAEITALSGSGTPTALNTGGSASPNDQLFFVAPVATQTTTSDADLRECGYFVVYASSDFGSMKADRYYLIRSHIASTDAGYDCFTASAPTWYQTPVSAPAFTTSSKLPVAENVVRFELDYLDSTGSWVDTWTSGTSLPKAVIVTMTVLDRRGAARLAAIKSTGLTSSEITSMPYGLAGLTNNAIYSVFAENSRTFTRQINLLNARGQ